MHFDGLGLSADYLRRAAYRREPLYALAAWSIVSVFLILLAGGAGYYYLSERDTAAIRFEAQAAAAEDQVKKLETAVAPIRRQLDLVRGWEAIMTTRVPASAVLAALESTMPEDFCLARARISVRSFDKPGDVRIPKEYLLELVGFMRKGDQQEIRSFFNALASKLPSAANVVSLEHVPGSPDQWALKVAVATTPDLARAGWRTTPADRP